MFTVLREKNGVIEDYDLGEELAYVRGLFLTSGKNEQKKEIIEMVKDKKIKEK